jgi:hypothetical protein
MAPTDRHPHIVYMSKIGFTFMVVVLFMSVLPGLVKAQEVSTTPEIPPKKVLDTGPVPSMSVVSFAGLDESFIPVQMPDGAPVYWSKLVYQSYRDQNWEIYTCDIAGSNQTNLTNNSTADARPRLNTRALKIAFNSDRGGNHDIYTMNSDGSGVTQVTNSQEADYAPAWSTDNTRLVFVSERDQNPEIYTIDLTSLVETRLTSDPAIDTSPAWSPDGARIAWVRIADMTGTLWIANADGSNPQPIYTALYLGHPVWSPDGARIGFDADLDGDYWNEIGVIHPDGTGLEILYDQGATMNDLWMGNWSNDQDWIFYTLIIYYIDGQGNLQISLTFVNKKKVGQSPNTVVSYLLDILPDLKVVDIDAPVSNVIPLAAYSRAAHFYMDWQGSDIGLSGLDYFDIQARVGAAGSWTGWLTGTEATSAIFTGTGGDTLYFRSRAEDNAGNLEAWPFTSTGDASTTLYTWLLSGQTQDTRSFTASNASLDISPAALSPLYSNKTGDFYCHLTVNGLHTLQAYLPGYGEPDPAHLNIHVDFNYNVVFPPQEDAMVNGGFETGGSQLPGWTITGTLPATRTTEVARTGNNAASLGVDCPEPCLGGIESVPEGGMSFMYQPSIVVGSDRTAHVLQISADRYLYYSQRPAGGSWSGGVQVGSGEGNSTNMSVDLAIDDLNILHAVWNAGTTSPTRIKYAYKTPAGNWSTPIDIGGGLMPKIASDHQGNVYAVWGGTPFFEVRKRTAAGNWEPTQVLGEGYSWLEAAIAVGPDNTVHMVYSNSPGIFYRSLSPAGVLSDVYTITPDETAVYTKIDVDSQGNLWVSWTARLISGDTGHYIIRSKAGEWSFAEDLPDITYLSDIEFDQADRMHILGGSSANTSNCSYILFQPDTGWYGPLVWSNNGLCTSSLAFDHLNRMHALLPTYVSLDYRSTDLALADGHVSIQQPVAIPTDTHQATLSWLYRVERHSLSIPSFTVSVSTGLTTTQVFASAAQAGWAHGWADVSAWAGQNVTVTFRLHQAEGEPLAHLYLDEVTLGSWLTPVPQHVTPSHLETWDATEVITITGLNFMETPDVQLNGSPGTGLEWVDEHTIRLHLPNDLPVGTYDVLVINPGGQVGILPSGLRLGKLMYLPITRK